MTGYCCVFKFLRRSVDGKHLMRFQSETSNFKFFQCSVEGALVSAIWTKVSQLMKKTDNVTKNQIKLS